MGWHNALYTKQIMHAYQACQTKGTCVAGARAHLRALACSLIATAQARPWGWGEWEGMTLHAGMQ